MFKLLFSVFEIGSCRRNGVETIERDRLVADFANTVDTLVHFLERVADRRVLLFELFYERDIRDQLFDLIRRVDRIGLFAFISFLRALPLARIVENTAVARELFLELDFFGLEMHAEFF